MTSRLRVRELAQERGIQMSDLIQQGSLTKPLVRRYWYNTVDGRPGGAPLRRIDLDRLDCMAQIIGVHTNDLITKIEVSVTEEAKQD